MLVRFLMFRHVRLVSAMTPKHNGKVEDVRLAFVFAPGRQSVAEETHIRCTMCGREKQHA